MSEQSSKTLHTLEELQQEAESFTKTLAPQDVHATLVTLSGELGAGKTSFTQGIATALGAEESVTSPTFVLEKIYDLRNQSFSRLIHIDAYRLEGETSLTPLGFMDSYNDPKALIVLEWPELVASQLPEAAHAITLRVVEVGREITYA